MNGYFYEGKWLKIESKEDLKFKPGFKCPVERKLIINNNLVLEATSLGDFIVKDGNNKEYII